MVDNYWALLDLIAPRRCRFCGADSLYREVFVAGRASFDCGICAACYRALPWNRPHCPRCALPQVHAAPCARCARRPPPFATVWAPLRLEAPVQQAVHALKYRAAFGDAAWLAALFASTLTRREAPLPELLLPVPLHRGRLCRRGYNQSVELARALARRSGIAVASNGARRLRATADQIGTSAAARRRNVRGAFAVDAVVAGKHVALLDDVMTTGATLAELTRAALAAGALSVEAWAIARVA